MNSGHMTNMMRWRNPPQQSCAPIPTLIYQEKDYLECLALTIDAANIGECTRYGLTVTAECAQNPEYRSLLAKGLLIIISQSGGSLLVRPSPLAYEILSNPQPC